MTIAPVIVINLDPNIARIGPFLLTWHGVFSVLGIIAGIWLAVQWSKDKVPAADVQETGFWGVIGAIIGARLFHVIDQWDFYSQNLWAIPRLTEGGIALWGGIVGGVVGGYLYARVRGLDIPVLLDVGGAGLALGQAIGRIGDIINGEHHAIPADLPWAVRYVHPDTLGERGLDVHPAVAYELLWDLAIVGILWRMMPRWRGTTLMFWTYLILYSAGRFLISFLRKDAIVLVGLRQAQVASLVALLVGIIAIIYLSQRGLLKRKS